MSLMTELTLELEYIKIVTLTKSQVNIRQKDDTFHCSSMYKTYEYEHEYA